MTGHEDDRIKLKSHMVRLSVGNHLIAFLISLEPYRFLNVYAK